MNQFPTSTEGAHNDEFFDTDDSFLKNPPHLPELPPLKSEIVDQVEMPESLQHIEPTPVWIRVAGIRFGTYGRVYDFNVGDADLKVDDAVVADAPEKGLMMGWIAKAPIKFDNRELKLRFPTITRIATAEDLSRFERAKDMEMRGIDFVKKHISRLNLDMQIIKLEYSLDLRKAMVYFLSENRVDFRELLKELVHDLKAKVELRQIGVRDHAKMLGGIGPCGEELCCSNHLNRFHAVNIKMAKDQNLSLKPTKVSGMCGRLKCCLQYEQDAYRDALKGLPYVGKKIKCSKGCGVVSEVDVLRQMVTVQFDDGLVAKVAASEVISDATLKNEEGWRNEKMVATTDSRSLVQQIKNVQKRDKWNESSESKINKNEEGGETPE